MEYVQSVPGVHSQSDTSSLFCEHLNTWGTVIRNKSSVNHEIKNLTSAGIDSHNSAETFLLTHLLYKILTNELLKTENFINLWEEQELCTSENQMLGKIWT
jgi:hypothetical protein